MSMPPYGIKPGRRSGGRRKAPPHRCDSILHAVGWTLLSAVLPGSGFLHGRRFRLGTLVLAGSMLALLVALVAAPHSFGDVLTLAVDPGRLTRDAVISAVCVAIWVVVVVATFVLLRPSPAQPRWQLLGGARWSGRCAWW